MKVHLSRRFSPKQLRGLLSNLTLVPPTLHPSQTAFSHSPTLPPYSSPFFSSFLSPRYSVVVRAENRLGEGPPSSPAHFLTLEEGIWLQFQFSVVLPFFEPNNSQDTGSVLLTLNVKERQKSDQMQGKILAWPPFNS